MSRHSLTLNLSPYVAQSYPELSDELEFLRDRDIGVGASFDNRGRPSSISRRLKEGGVWSVDRAW